MIQRTARRFTLWPYKGRQRSVIGPLHPVNTSTPSEHGLEAIPRNRVYTKVAAQLQAHILNKLKPGDMLPPERELVKRFGVSRSSIRDAIRSLEAVGLLEPRQGVGTVVRDLSSDVVVNPVAGALLQKRRVINELLDVRMIIEPALARRAALHASAKQIAEMEAILGRQEEKIRRGELATEEDSAFHYTIALAADNSVMLKLANVLMDLLRETRERSLQVGGRQEKSLAAHRRILAALKQGDAAAAEAATRRHLLEIERIVLQKL
jgi:GntR family transcriptional regulator, transcriptional repressor for pyruvate dehydrogenase complex